MVTLWLCAIQVLLVTFAASLSEQRYCGRRRLCVCPSVCQPSCDCRHVALVFAVKVMHCIQCTLVVRCVCSTLGITKYDVIWPNDTAAPPAVSPPSSPLYPGVTWPTPSGINETEARRICEAPILQSAVYSLCENFTAQALQMISSSCMLDLQVNLNIQNILTVLFGILHLSCGTN